MALAWTRMIWSIFRTIAKSGTTEFLAKLEAAKDEDKSKSLN